MQVGIKDNKVVALYTNSVSNWNSKKGIRFGSTAASVRKAYGQPLVLFKKDNTDFILIIKKAKPKPIPLMMHLLHSFMIFIIIKQ